MCFPPEGKRKKLRKQRSPQGENQKTMENAFPSGGKIKKLRKQRFPPEGKSKKLRKHAFIRG